MKKLIRDRATGKFLRPSGAWTQDPSFAQNFPHISDAIKVEQKFHLTGIELVFMSDEKPSIYDVVIPLGRSEARL